MHTSPESNIENKRQITTNFSATKKDISITEYVQGLATSEDPSDQQVLRRFNILNKSEKSILVQPDKVIVVDNSHEDVKKALIDTAYFCYEATKKQK